MVINLKKELLETPEWAAPDLRIKRNSKELNLKTFTELLFYFLFFIFWPRVMLGARDITLNKTWPCSQDIHNLVRKVNRLTVQSHVTNILMAV